MVNEVEMSKFLWHIGRKKEAKRSGHASVSALCKDGRPSEDMLHGGGVRGPHIP
jgi:hypothetical protein